jgi:hypothetical protein
MASVLVVTSVMTPGRTGEGARPSPTAFIYF